jgi:hypothetical protein
MLLILYVDFESCNFHCDVGCGLFLLLTLCGNIVLADIVYSGFLWNYVEFLLNDFSAFIKIIKWFLSFIQLMWSAVMFIGLHMLGHPCIPGMKSYWSQCMSFLICYWMCFVSILLRFLCLCSLKRLVYNSFFLLCPCLVLALQNEFGSVPSISVAWKCLKSIGISSFLMLWQNLGVIPLGSGHHIVG